MDTVFAAAFSHPGAVTTPWGTTERELVAAELYWLTTVRRDARPHVTPLVGVWLDSTFYFTTGRAEQKARNLASHADVAATTGRNDWAEGLDVVVEGTATRRCDHDELEHAAEGFRTKYGDDWPFERRGEQLSAGADHLSDLWGVTPAKVLAFAKNPHGQTAYRF